ncbi:MAG: ThiF family adenylyltransferase [Nannocystis sp.]|nr:ThiF family adenylyltransferase [Nannocystis sp.]
MTATTLSEHRLRAEREAIAERYRTVVPLSADLEVPIFEGAIDVDGVDYQVRLILPPRYPSIPPVVGEIDGPGGRVVRPEWSMYRFSDGTICLFPHGNDSQTWGRDRLAVEALDRFVELKRLEIAQDRGPRRALYQAGWRLVVPPGIARVMLLPGSHGTIRVRAASTGRGDRFVDAIRFDAPQIPPVEIGASSPWIAALTAEQWIPWVHHAFDGRSWGEIGRTADHLEEELQAALPEAHCRRIRTSAAIALVRGSDPAGAEPDLALFARDPQRVGVLHTPEVVLAAPEDLFYQRVDGVMNDRDALAEATVVMIGLGSLGSAVALALARAGVRHFVLVDPDDLRIDNVCRHVGTLRDLGRLKVEVVGDAITSINPLAAITTIAKWFAWDLPGIGAGVEIDRLLAETSKTILISTCAVGRVEQQINELSVRRGVPAVYGTALGAAEHARVFRVIPGETPCYACIIAAQDREPERHPRFAIDGVLAELHAPYVDPSLPGLGVDITMIAMIAARVALQTAARVVEVTAGLGPEDDHVLWTNRGGWVFDRPLQASAERFSRDPACPVCGSTPA